MPYYDKFPFLLILNKLDQKLFCSFLGANSEEEIKELYYILNRMDATLFFNDLSFQSYKTTKPLSYHEAKKAIGFDYKLLIFRKVLEQLKEYTKTHFKSICIITNKIAFSKKN